MIIEPTTTLSQDTILAANNVTVDDLLKTLIKYKIDWMNNRAAYPSNGCSEIVTPSGGTVTLTTGQVNFLKQDFQEHDPETGDPVGDPLANIEAWAQNYIDDTCRRLNDGEGLII